MREQRKGYDRGYDYADFIKHGKKNHPKSLRRVERKLARRKRRRLNRAVRNDIKKGREI